MLQKNLHSCLFVRVVCVVLGFLLVLSPAAASANQRLVFGESQWDSQSILNAIARFVIENGFDGYEVDFSTASSSMNWQSMIIGDVDVEIEVWPDNVPTFARDVADGDIIPLGVVVTGGIQGVYIPRYMIYGCPERDIEPTTPTLRHVADLTRYAHIFRDPEDPSVGRFFAPIPTWAFSSEIMQNKFSHYNLNDSFNFLRVGSEAVLFASLMSAYNLGEPWVGFLYEPSWIVGRLDLVMLEDEPFEPELFRRGATAFPSQDLLIVSSRYFAQKAPDLLDFLNNFNTCINLVNEALAHLEETGDSHAEIAVWFMRTHDSLLDEWLAPEQAERVRRALAGS